ncbi:hypothetical protein Y032_0041g368 [Ancylostoma ceylanicum]|uniref:Uncharacterized protein n=1 Tax=Ancylostoma ceylanicum TaxID=53326 RepID=A0A016UG73_9BILA|nr:hypothetical protein Y032_0041g368 [Ancylostoma ceylanicum]
MCISAVFNILSCVFDTGQHSLPYIIAGLTMDEVCNSLLPVLTCEAVDLINQTRQDALPTLLPWVAGSTRRHSGGGGLPPQIARDVEQRTLIKET